MKKQDLSKVTILVVDDDIAVRDSLSEFLSSLGWNVETADNAELGLNLVKQGIADIVISDIQMPGMSGLELLQEIKAIDSDIEVLITTGFSSEDIAIEALKRGAYDYFRKPIDSDELEKSLHRTNRICELVQENRRLKALLERVSKVNDQHSFVGQSHLSQELAARISKIAKSPLATVFINGESGVGKEVAARMIHQLSDNHDAPFIAVNCGGIAETLLESELFGHEKGSFTGAERRATGVFEMALNGTVLLDEISEMSMKAQSRFLRVLEDRRFYRVGGSKEVDLENTRIIAATNKDLKKMVDEGTFREDLYYRIMVAPVYISPLRERRDDILPLAYHFLERYCELANRKIKLSPEAEKCLKNYDFPGNARDMRNIIDRACIFCDNDIIQVNDLGIVESDSNNTAAVTNGHVSTSIENLCLKDNEVALINAAINKYPSNHSAAARELGITAQALYRKLEKYEIKK